MRIQMDGHLVWLVDPDGNEGNLPSAVIPDSSHRSEAPVAVDEVVVKTSRKGKKKVTESSHLPNVNIAAKDRRRLKIGLKANRLEMDLPLLTSTRQTSGRGNNHIALGDTTREVPPISSKLPSDEIMEESVSQMTTMLSNILEHHERANQRLASLEEDLVHTKREEEKLKATTEALEREKSEMNARVALMERKNLYKLLEAKMEGFQIANHLGTIRGFKNLNLTITRKWVEIPTFNLEEFEKCPVDYPESDGYRYYYSSLCEGLKATIGTLPNSLAIFDYMQSIFDSYIDPTNDPNVQPLVKGLDADDFSVDKFFGLQDPTSPDDVQAGPDFEEDLTTNECLRLRVESRNLTAEPQQLTNSTHVCLEYELTILSDVPPTDNPALSVTFDLTVDARKDPSSLPKSQIVLVPTFVDIT
ncbi:hypothetical protein R1flu_013829 [Riccia fluitans]|uniref:Uncharacterized protein n=1 Tax=Riccia fluitans TaxID=41844 RepID=A0ABD1YEI3_9MARC